MRRHNRQYTYRLTAIGIGYVMTHCTSIPDNATLGSKWAIYRRHNTKHSPWNFELWLNDKIFIDRWDAKTIRHWRQAGYIVPHADTWHKHICYAEKLLSKSSIEVVKDD